MVVSSKYWNVKNGKLRHRKLADFTVWHLYCVIQITEKCLIAQVIGKTNEMWATGIMSHTHPHFLFFFFLLKAKWCIYFYLKKNKLKNYEIEAHVCALEILIN